MRKGRRIIIVLIALVLSALVLLFANWFFSPFLMPRSGIERQLMVEVFEFRRNEYEREGRTLPSHPVYVGIWSATEPRDFSEPDMTFWNEHGYLVLPLSLLEPAPLGQIRDKNTKQAAEAIIFKDYSWQSRNVVDVNIIGRSGFCANGTTLTLRRDLWGWTFLRWKWFHNF